MIVRVVGVMAVSDYDLCSVNSAWEPLKDLVAYISSGVARFWRECSVPRLGIRMVALRTTLSSIG
jgi:hypothetical protein